MIQSFCEEFKVHRGEFIDTNRIKKVWKESNTIEGALTAGRRMLDERERFQLYISFKNFAEIPAFDDFVVNMKTGVSYRILTCPNVRRTPVKAGIKCCVCTVTRADLPGGGVENG